jgi:hypothetical protein
MPLSYWFAIYTVLGLWILPAALLFVAALFIEAVQSREAKVADRAALRALREAYTVHRPPVGRVSAAVVAEFGGHYLDPSRPQPDDWNVLDAWLGDGTREVAFYQPQHRHVQSWRHRATTR